MKPYKKYNYSILVLGILLSITSSYAQIITKTKQLMLDVKQHVNIELNSTYTNLEFEIIDTNTIVIDAVMDLEGMSEKEANTYFKKWNLNANELQHKVVINSIVENRGNNLNRNGYYKGYFIDKNQRDEINSEINKHSVLKSKKATKTPKETRIFDYDAYVKDGNAYLLKWQKQYQEPIGKRWFDKTKKERIQLQKAIKAKQPKKQKLATKSTILAIHPRQNLKVKLDKKTLPKTTVRALSKRTIINKTLKIKIPRHAQLTVKARHGKVVFSNEVNNLQADLSYVLLQANTINGSNTSIKGAYTNIEVAHWKTGNLEVEFSDFVLIKETTKINIVANASTVSIDAVTENINAKGNFKMLSIDLSATLKFANIDVEDSKKVWVKLPSNLYNLSYEGTNSTLIHPEKFSLKKASRNSGVKVIKDWPLKNNTRSVSIKALASVLQIYDTSWNQLKIKSLEGL